MRTFAAISLTILSLQAAWAAVLPVGVAALGGRHFSSALSVSSAALEFRVASVSGEWSADARNTWRDDDGEPRIQINLRGSAGDHRWGFGVRLRDLSTDDLVRLAVIDVTVAHIRGLSVQSPGDAVDLAIHGPRWRKRQ